MTREERDNRINKVTRVRNQSVTTYLIANIVATIQFTALGLLLMPEKLILQITGAIIITSVIPVTIWILTMIRHEVVWGKKIIAEIDTLYAMSNNLI